MSEGAHVAGRFKSCRKCPATVQGSSCEGGGGAAAAEKQHAFVLAESVDQCGLQESTDNTPNAPPLPCCELNFGIINAVSPGIQRDIKDVDR